MLILNPPLIERAFSQAVLRDTKETNDTTQTNLIQINQNHSKTQCVRNHFAPYPGKSC